MAYEIGIATDYKDLLERLKDFISDPYRTIDSGDSSITELVPIDSDVDSGEPSQAWTIEKWDTTDEYEMIAKGPGSGADEVFIGIQTESGVVAAGNYSNWIQRGFTGYVSGTDFDEQPGSMTYPPRILLKNDSLPYWFFANGRRVMFAIKVDLVYEVGYMGFILPYATSAQYPYPLAIGGSYGGTTAVRYSDVTDSHAGFHNGYAYSSLVLINGVWQNFHYGITTRCNWPYGPHDTNTSGYGDVQSQWQKLSGSLDDSSTGAVAVPIIPLLIGSSGALGEYDGCYAVAHIEPSSEDTIEIDGDTYVIFQNIFRTAAYEYVAFKKE